MRSEGRVDVAFILPALWGGGVERVYLDLAEQFVRKGFGVDLVLAKAEGPMLGQVPSGVRVIDLKVPRRLRLVRTSWPLLHYFATVAPRVAIPVWGYLDYLPLWAAWKAGVPTLWVLHSTPDYFGDLPGMRRWFALRFAQRALRESLLRSRARVGAVSKGVAEAFGQLGGVKVEKIRVLPNPIDVGRIRLLAQEAIPSLPFEERSPYLVAVGRLHPEKGFDLLIEAFALLKRRLSEKTPYLLMLGEGPERLYLERLAKDLGVSERVLFLGWTSNPYPYVARSLGLVVSSRYEGLPTVVLEALALGVPVVATEAPGGLLEALDYGRMGILTPRTAEGLALGMEKLLVEGFVLEEAKVIRHLERYSPDRAFGKYMEVIQELWA
ncbi:glycosyl transferase [Thermus brockianus]|uniref:Glycosyl transferase n=1 Tax=Thermus brockianus TaxID=56956 RepID=A0ABM7XIY8_THEBO|nr:glycosyl transferase [Thermus brockianus]